VPHSAHPQGICYSESKKKDRSSTPKVAKSTINIREENEDLEAESPLEMLRYALLQLSTLESNLAASGDATPIANITSLLQVRNVTNWYVLLDF
jgi:hypothetical protein